jgi:hypothetical protein
MRQDIIFYRLQESLYFIYEEVLYIIFIEFGISMKLVRLINMYLTETCSRFRVGKNLSDIFPIRNDLKKEMIYCHCFLTLLYSTPLGGFR